MNQGRVSLEQLARAMAEYVARQFDMYPAKGVLQVGSDADIVVFDTKTSRVARGEELQSASQYTIFEGEELSGWPERVYVRGQLVADQGQIVATAPAGRYVPAQ